MCMFSKPVDVVSNTKLIYALLTDPQSGRRFALQTYENRVKLPAGQPHTTMILPVPVASINSVKLCNDKRQTAAAEQLFTLLHDKFAKQDRAETQDLFGGFTLGASIPTEALPVVKSGSYMVSFVPSIDDLDRCDSDIFKLNNEELKTLLMAAAAAAGNTRFVYIVAVLQANTEYHPFAYAYELEKHAKDAFVPTMHFHPHSHPFCADRPGPMCSIQWNGVCATHPRASAGQPCGCQECALRKRAPRYQFTGFGTSAEVASSNHAYADDWDHEIMVLGVGNVTSEVGSVTSLRDFHSERSGVNPLLQNIFPSGMAAPISCKPLAHRIVVKGYARNVDISFPLRTLLHEGVHCDECRQPIPNDRLYHCTLCPDINLCATCEAKETRAMQQKGECHSGHPFVLLKTPLQISAYGQILARMHACCEIANEFESIENGVKWLQNKVGSVKDASERLRTANGASSAAAAAAVTAALALR